jgi:hypothetical protein
MFDVLFQKIFSGLKNVDVCVHVFFKLLIILLKTKRVCVSALTAQ